LCQTRSITHYGHCNQHNAIIFHNAPPLIGGFSPISDKHISRLFKVALQRKPSVEYSTSRNPTFLNLWLLSCDTRRAPQEMASTRFDVQFKAQSCCRFTGVMTAVSSISHSPLFRGPGPYVPLQGENSPSFLCRVKPDGGAFQSLGWVLGTSPAFWERRLPPMAFTPEVNVIMNWNRARAQGARGGGFLCLLVKSKRDLLPISRCDISPPIKE